MRRGSTRAIAVLAEPADMRLDPYGDVRIVQVAAPGGARLELLRRGGAESR
jgi:hypothetical protein